MSAVNYLITCYKLGTNILPLVGTLHSNLYFPVIGSNDTSLAGNFER